MFLCMERCRVHSGKYLLIGLSDRYDFFFSILYYVSSITPQTFALIAPAVFAQQPHLLPPCCPIGFPLLHLPQFWAGALAFLDYGNTRLALSGGVRHVAIGAVHGEIFDISWHRTV